MEPRQVITPAQDDIRLSSDPTFIKEPSNKAIKGVAIAVLVLATGSLFLKDGSPVQAGGGGPWETPTPTRTKTPTPRPTNTALPTATRIPATETPRPTATLLPTATRVPATETPRPTNTPLPTATEKPTVTPIATIIKTIESTPTLIPTKTKVPPTVTPVSTREIRPTPTKKKKPTATPTKKPLPTPTRKAIPRPTATKAVSIFPTPKPMVLPHTGGDQRFLDEQNLYSAPERFVTDELYNELVVEDNDDEILGSVDFNEEEIIETPIDQNDAITLFKAAVTAAVAGSGLFIASRRRRNK